MKKKELLSSLKRVEDLVARSPRARNLTKAHLRNGKWLDPASDLETASGIAKELDTARAAPSGWSRRRSSSSVAFWFADLSAAIQVEFVARPSSTTVQQFRKQLNEELQNAGNEYRANHDQWTGCLNKAANDRALLATVARIRGNSAADPGNAVASAVTRAYLLALDLDHFKSINDRFGHLYGDLVLRVFSIRVDKVYSAWVAENAESDVSVIFSRPGGEEFQVLVEGKISQDAVLGLAERIRRAIGEQELPADDEYHELREGGRCDEVDLPPTKHRSVTVSIGVAALTVRSEYSDKDTVSRLQRDADRALYSAKSGGRDCVRLFSDLLRRFGRVVASHSSTALISIDIGSDVGVELGQEFLVYPPEFVGGVPYVIGEGRSRKQLGEFPKYAVAQISAVQVQAEVTFCKVESWNAGVERALPQGSFLEAIPLGSISHLITNVDTLRAPGLVAVEAIRRKLSGSPDGAQHIVVGLRIIGLRKYATERGFAAANKLLASVYSVIAANMGNGIDIASVSEDCFVFVPNADGDFDAIARDFLKEKIEEVCRDKVKVGIGWFISSEFPQVKPSYGVELGLMAAAAHHGDESVQFFAFSDRVASDVIYRARMAEQYESARADAAKLSEIGIRLPYATNQFGLLEYSLGNYEQAAIWFSSAFEMAPAISIFGLNLGLAYFQLKDWRRSYDTFKRIETLAHDDAADDFDKRFLGTYLVAARWLQKEEGTVDRQEVARILDLALATELVQFFGVDRPAIEKFSERFSEEF